MCLGRPEHLPTLQYRPRGGRSRSCAVAEFAGAMGLNGSCEPQVCAIAGSTNKTGTAKSSALQCGPVQPAHPPRRPRLQPRMAEPGRLTVGDGRRPSSPPAGNRRNTGRHTHRRSWHEAAQRREWTCPVPQRALSLHRQQVVLLDPRFRSTRTLSRSGRSGAGSGTRTYPQAINDRRQ